MKKLHSNSKINTQFNNQLTSENFKHRFPEKMIGIKSVMKKSSANSSKEDKKTSLCIEKITNIFSCAPRDTDSFNKPITSRLHNQTAANCGEHQAITDVRCLLAAIRELLNKTCLYFVFTI